MSLASPSMLHTTSIQARIITYTYTYTHTSRVTKRPLSSPSSRSPLRKFRTTPHPRRSFPGLDVRSEIPSSSPPPATNATETNEDLDGSTLIADGDGDGLSEASDLMGKEKLAQMHMRAESVDLGDVTAAMTDDTLISAGSPQGTVQDRGHDAEEDTAEDNAGEDTYEVDAILDVARRGRGRGILIKWKGYTDPTWEAEKKFRSNCGDQVLRMLDDFLAQHGLSE